MSGLDELLAELEELLRTETVRARYVRLLRARQVALNLVTALSERD